MHGMHGMHGNGDGAGAWFEALEPRVLLSVRFTIDYGYDALGFFDDPTRREVMQAAADWVGSLLEDDLLPIVPGGSNRWTVQFSDPATGAVAQIDNPTIDQDELLLFVGGRDLGGDTLGLGGAGGWSASGSGSFLLLVEGRGQSGATGPDAGRSDTSLWGGSIAFDIDSSWHFGTTSEGLDPSEHDFYSVAVHELLHVLGFSDANAAFANLVSPSGQFLGPQAQAVGSDTRLQPGDNAHWIEGLSSAGQESLMDPTFSRGVRKLITPLDAAAMQDIGWMLAEPRYPGRGSAVALSPSGTGIASGTASPGTPGLHWIDARTAGLLDLRLTSDAPVTLRLWDSRGLLVAEMDQPDALAGLAIQAQDQFYTLEVLAQSPASYDLAVTNSPVDVLAYYPEGFASQLIDASVSIVNPTDTAQLLTLELRYERQGLGRQADTIADQWLIQPKQRLTIPIVQDGVLAQDEPTGRSILAYEPFAIVLRSSARLGAALEHADEFLGQRITTAEDFSTSPASTWHFPRVEKAQEVFDFLTFYNPNEHAAQVTVRFVSLSGQVVLGQTIPALSRGGLNVQAIGALAQGAFGVVVTSVAQDAGDQASHQGIVAALTHFNAAQGEGWTVLGTAGPLPTSAAAALAPTPAGMGGASVHALVFNPGQTTARLRLVRSTDAGEQTLAERFVPAGVSSAIMLPEAQGYRYEFLAGMGVVQFVQVYDLESTSASPTAAQPAGSGVLAFALGSLDDLSDQASLGLTVFNDADAPASVSVRLVFAQGVELVEPLTVQPRRFAELDLDALAGLRSRQSDGPIGVVLEANRPILGMLWQVDPLRGWASSGTWLPA
ncbi:MAG: hypothetical protein KatS3mg103_1223 [Phycisphaerales bacterium]|nr:MAG: hypothetical protein KatS3mg103_1223 [Phycisphaerales bacterium]